MDLPPRQSPTLRASDADRERVATLLRENYTEGRLTLEEFQERLEQAYAAKTFGELGLLTRDLPAPLPSPQPFAPSAPRPRAPWMRNEVISFVTVSLFFIVLWALTGIHHAFWPVWIIVPWGFALAMRAIHGASGRSSPRQRARRRRENRYRDE